MRNYYKRLISGIIALSLFTSTLGGAFVSSVYAAESETLESREQIADNGKADKGVIAGLVAVGLIAALSSKGSSGSKSTTPPSGSTPPSSSASDEQQALNLVNQDRAKNGLSALKANSQLTVLARNYAKDMIQRGFFSHYNPEGQSPFDRMKQAGISYKTAGENLAINSSVAGAQTAFMNSSGHRANILNPSFTEVGIGVVRASNGQVYVVQEFIGR